MDRLFCPLVPYESKLIRFIIASLFEGKTILYYIIGTEVIRPSEGKPLITVQPKKTLMSDVGSKL